MPRINLGRKKPRVQTFAQAQAQKVYQDIRWKSVRAQKLMYNPVCENCERQGKSTLTEEIHHKIPFSQAKTYEMWERLAFSIENLESLCEKCHENAHRKLRNQR